MTLEEALKYADSTAVSELVKGMHLNDWLASDHEFNPEGHEQDRTKRGVLADAYEESTGDTAGADLLRDHTKTVAFHKGKMKEGVLKHRLGFSWHTGTHYPDYGEQDEYLPLFDKLRKGKADEVHADVVMGLDTGEGDLTEDAMWSDGNENHHSLVGYSPTTLSYRLHSYGEPPGELTLVEHHILPLSQANKTYLHGRG